jgi:PilZ domain
LLFAMSIFTLLADFSMDPPVLYLKLTVPVIAGAVAGLGVVGLIHYLIRPRIAAKVAVAPAAAEAHDPFLKGSVGELRKSFRRQGCPVEVLAVNQQTNAAPFKAYVVNRSVGGLGLLLENPIAPETPMTVRPINAPQIAPWIEVVVKSCRESNVGWEVGCQFVKTPPWALLLMFG